jgi:PAS domain S-box-containing protein
MEEFAHGPADCDTRRPVPPPRPAIGEPATTVARGTWSARETAWCLAAALLFGLLALLLRALVAHNSRMLLSPAMPLFGAATGALLGLYWLRMRRIRQEGLRSISHVARSEARLAGIIRSSMEAIITVDHEQHVILFNPRAEALFGWQAAQVLGRPLGDLIPERFRAAHASHVRRFGVTGISDRQMGRQQTLFALRSDGTEFPIEASISQTVDGDTRLFTVMLRDITDRVSAEAALRLSREELQQLSDSVLSMREQEKRRIARELHDDLGQRLSALKMDAVMLASDIRDARPAADLLDQIDAINRVIDETVGSVRRIASDLRPALLDELGMLPAIEWLAKDFAARYKLDVQVHGVDAQVSEQTAIAVFRIVQEALSNVVRHASASTAVVGLRCDDAQLSIEVRDDGVGWTGTRTQASNGADRKHLGLLGIRERARLLGGTVTVLSEPGSGFCLRVDIPLSKEV